MEAGASMRGGAEGSHAGQPLVGGSSPSSFGGGKAGRAVMRDCDGRVR
jgi:hypothetical protein